MFCLSENICVFFFVQPPQTNPQCWWLLEFSARDFDVMKKYLFLEGCLAVSIEIGNLLSQFLSNKSVHFVAREKKENTFVRRIDNIIRIGLRTD